MSQTTKIVVAVIITALVVGGGVYLWQQQSTTTDGQSRQVVSENEKVWEGNGFSFVYPAEYIADTKGLWTKDDYERHINPPAQCSTCQIPYYEVKTENSSQSLDQYIIDDFNLPGNTLDEAMSQTGIPYEQVSIGNNDFVKITISDLYDVTGYYTKYNNQVVAFRVYWNNHDTSELQNIISTLKFD